MPQQLVNLDALVPREDFQIVDPREYPQFGSLKINDFEKDSFTWSCLRKPPFQRETANWSPNKVVDLLESFLNGDFVPNIILWRVGETLFVIDGAHRLSAIAAWVQNDYGAGDLSRKFFKNAIPPEQVKSAESARKRVEAKFKTYNEHLLALKHTDETDPEVVKRARRFGSLAIGIQWVPTPDQHKAQASFFKINQQGTPLDKTEALLLQARDSAVGFASRAIVRNATGHQYWAFPEHKVEIENVAREIYSTLFSPPIPTPMNTVDLPPAGRGYGSQALPLTFDLVHIANRLPVIDVTKNKKETFKDDTDGALTVEYLKGVRKAARRISGRNPSSLGLHPAIYFYSTGGRHQPTALYAIIALMTEWENTNKFADFTKIRARFEDFLKAYKQFVNQVTTKQGSGVKGFAHLKDMFIFIMGLLHQGKADDQIVEALRADKRFDYLSVTEGDDENMGARKDRSLSGSVKNAAFLIEALKAQIKCKHCGAAIGPASISNDHVDRKRDGGAGTVMNTQLMHPFCNSGLKS